MTFPNLKTLILIIGAIFIASQSQADSVGTRSLESLQIGVDAKSVAMGEAVTASISDANAMHWNVAGLADIDNLSVSLTHNSYIESTSLSQAAVAKRMGEKNVVGLMVRHFTAGSIDQTADVSGNSLGSFTPTDLSANLGFAHRFDSGLSIGLAGKFIQSEILDSATAFSGDAGLMFAPILNEKLTLGLSARNIGGSIKYESESEDLPLEFRGGLLFRVLPKLALTIDLVSPSDADFYVAAGSNMDFSLTDNSEASVRAGYNGRDTDSEVGISGLSAGAGLKWSSLNVDYAITPFGDLGLVHRITVGLYY